MKVLLDTNVLFSGLAFRGVVGSLLEELVQQGHTLVTSEYILEDLREKIRLKVKEPYAGEALGLLEHLLHRAPLEIKPLDGVLSHLQRARELVPAQDAPILALAMLDDVDYFVTGDEDFLGSEEVRSYLGRKLKSPREMLELLSGEPPSVGRN